MEYGTVCCLEFVERNFSEKCSGQTVELFHMSVSDHSWFYNVAVCGWDQESKVKVPVNSPRYSTRHDIDIHIKYSINIHLDPKIL